MSASQGASTVRLTGDAERGSTAKLDEAAPTTGGAAMAAKSKLSALAAKWLQLEKDKDESELAFAVRYVPNARAQRGAQRCEITLDFRLSLAGSRLQQHHSHACPLLVLSSSLRRRWMWWQTAALGEWQSLASARGSEEVRFGCKLLYIVSCESASVVCPPFNGLRICCVVTQWITRKRSFTSSF